jgi:hypothetical protein
MKAREEMMNFFGEFIPKEKITSFISNLQTLLMNVKEDAEMNALVNQLKEYTMKMIENPELLEDPGYIQQSEDIFQRGKLALKQFKYKDDYNQILMVKKRKEKHIKPHPSISLSLAFILLFLTASEILFSVNRI